LFLAFCLVPTFLVFALFTVYPIVNGLYLSLFEWSGTSSVKEFIGMANYKELFKDAVIRKAIFNDYFLVFTKVIGIMVLSMFFAVALTQLRIKEAPFYRV